MTGITRRHAQEAGRSWRKWGDPIVQARPRRLRAVVFWLLCIDLGALAGLLVTR